MNSYLVKFTKERYAEELQSGNILFRSIAAFSDIRKSDWPFPDKSFSPDVLGGLCFANGEGAGLIDVLTLREKIYCMYQLKYNGKKSFICPDNRICEFGDTAIIIYNPMEFIRRLASTICDRFKDFFFHFGEVSYDATLFEERVYDIFSKPLVYSYQNEFRFALDLANGKFHPKDLANVSDFAKLTFPGKIEEDSNPFSIADTLSINIGDIHDISIAVQSSELVTKDSRYLDVQNYSVSPSFLPSFHPSQEPYPTFFKPIIDMSILP